MTITTSARPSFRQWSHAWLWFFTLVFAQVNGQGSFPSMKFENHTMENGLSSGWVNCLVQDQQGFIWIGTRDGLNKFDGYRFKVYRHEPGESNSLSNNYVRALCMDSKGRIWIGTKGGLNMLDPVTEQITRYFHDPADVGSLSDDDVISIYEDSHNRLWVGTQNGLNVYNETSAAFRRYDDQSSAMEGKAILSILEDGEGNLWTGTWGGGLNLYDERTDDFRNFSHLSHDPSSLADDNIMALSLDAEGSVWAAGFFGTISKIDARTHRITNYHIETQKGKSIGFLQTIHQHENGYLLIGSHEGLYLWNPKSNQLAGYTHLPHDPESVADNTITAFLSDQDKNLWLGTANGLSYFNPTKIRFQEKLSGGIPGNDGRGLPVNVFSLISLDSVLWIGTDKGVLLYDLHDEQVRKPSFEGRGADILAECVVQHIYRDSAGFLWIATNKGTFQVPPGTKQPRLYRTETHLGQIFNDLDHTAILEFQKDEIWIASDAGVKIMNRKGEMIGHLFHDREATATIGNNRINCLFKDSRNRVWIGTKGGGLNVYNGDSNSILRFDDKARYGSLVKAFVHSISESATGRILIAANDGLHILDPSTHEITVYNHRNGLASNIIFACFEDSEGNFWLSTGKGIAKLNTTTGFCKNFEEKEGLQSYTFNRGAYYRAPSGHIFFGGKNGLNIFHPDSVKLSTKWPSVYITSIAINNKTLAIGDDQILERSIAFTEKIDLPYPSNVISIEFAALNFSLPQKSAYRYKLEGFDQEWKPADESRTANYTNLDPGTYTFLVKAANEDGVWMAKPTRLVIYVQPPFWKTWWAYSLYLVCIVLALYFFQKYSLISVKAKNRFIIQQLENKKAHEITEAKMRFFTNVSHEIRTPLTLISGPLQKVLTEGKLDDPSRHHLALVSKHVNRLLQQANQLLQFRKIDMGHLSLNTSETSISLFIQEIIGYFEQHAMLKNIRIIYESSVQNDLHLWIDRELITTALYNLLANALKFTPSGGSVTIRVNEYEVRQQRKWHILKRLKKGSPQKWLSIEIKDTGKGISRKDIKHIFQRFYQVHDEKQNAGGSGVGLSLVKEFIELHKGNVVVESKLNEGSTFTVFLPVLAPDTHRGQRPTHDAITTQFEDLIEEEKTLLKNLSNTNNFKGTLPQLLVVEDDVELAAFISDLLSKSFRIATAENGVEGLEAARKLMPDVILSDVAMPEMDGFQFCSMLKKDMSLCHIPVILLTAKATDEDTFRGYGCGADAYVTKPFNIRILEAQIHALLEGRRLLREKFARLTLIEPSEIKVESQDEKFLKQLMEQIEQNVSNEAFDVGHLVETMGMSHNVLYKKFKSLTGFTLVEFIKQVRLKRAAMFLQQEKLPIAEVCYRVGFSDPRYFSKCFVKEFGKTPTEYAAEHQFRKTNGL